MSTGVFLRDELVRGEVLPNLDDDEDLRARVVETLILDGRPLDVKIADAIADVVEEATIEETSTLIVSLVDVGHELLASSLFDRAVDVEVGSGDDVIVYRLRSISAPPNRLILTFEDRDVAYLRQHKRPRKAPRSRVTMAEFVLMLVREVKATRIRVWSPELHEKQPIKKRRDLDPRAVKDRRRGRGIGDDEEVKVKGKRADRAQVRVIEAHLDVGDSMKATRRVLIGGQMAVTQESSARNLRGGDRDSVGAFQQRRSQGWPASRDVARDARAFYSAAIPVFRANPSESIGWCVDQVQRSYTFDTSRQGADYDQWRAEAEQTVDAYLGDAPAAGGGRPASVYTKRFWFRRGEPGGKREDTWECAGRLAEERHWRRFMDRGILHLASDEQLLDGRVRLTIRRNAWPKGIARVQIGDFDARRPVAEVELTVFADSWRVPIGAVVKLEGYGKAASGRYLVGSRRGSLLRATRTVKLIRPRPKLAEPASELVTRSDGSAPTGKLAWPTKGHRVSSPFGQRWGRLHDGIDIAVPTGSNVYASDGGKVTMAGANGGYGLYVSIDHGEGLVTFYGHLSRVDVSKGDRVSQGDPVGLSGNTGASRGPHLHFGVHKRDRAVDPLPLLRGDPPRSPKRPKDRYGRRGPLATG